jgi:C4-type Zn-finger protein
MSAEVVKRWIEAGKILAQDVTAQVPCPVCQSEMLQISDVVNEANPAEVERHMICRACRARNSLRLVRPT